MRPRAAWGIALVLLALALPARAERILDFDVFLNLDASGNLAVEERIRWDFEGEQKHGIYREIPVDYERPGSSDYHIGVRVGRVTDGAGAALPVKTTSAGGYVRIRIGDPDRTVTGVHEYRIRYVVNRAVLFFDDHDELYWNATGTEWPVAIGHTEAHVTVPKTDQVRIELGCFTGGMGSTERACRGELVGPRSEFVATRRLDSREGMTVVVGVPKGVIAPPTAWQRFRWWLDDTGGRWAVLPFAVLAMMSLAWRRFGRDPKIGEAIAVQYEPPPGFTPAEVGTIYDESADLDDVTSTILDLAIRGWIRIEEVEAARLLFFSMKDYRLVRLPDPAGQTLKPHEEKMLAGLFEFGVKDALVSDLREKFYTHLPGVQEAIYEELSGTVFAANPRTVRQVWNVIAIVVVIAGFVAAAPYGPVAAVAICASAAIMWVMGRAMPRRTRHGREAYERIAGLREFIRRVEADRLERLGGRTAGTFEKILPYAVVLGVADRWAHAFAGIYATPPTWYVGSNHGLLDTNDLVRNVGRSMDTMGRTLTSHPTSSGSGSSGFSSGGSSGGGFGGGGGGSW